MDNLLRATARAEAQHFWFRGFRTFVTPLLRRATEHRPDARILDCGCGTGANLTLLGRFGRAYGFDLSEVGLSLARERGQRVVRASVAAAPFGSGSFDVVASFDVLYALDPEDETAAAAEMFRLLRPGGAAVVNVAAMPALTGDHSVLSDERRRYTRRSLRALLEGAGFRIERLTYTNAALFVPMLARRTFQRWRGLAAEREAEAEIMVPPAALNLALTLLLRLEALWLRVGHNPCGSSLLCLARKPG